MSDRSPLFYSAVFVLLKQTDGKYLLQQRASTGFMDGHYDISATGHVEYGESIVTAALRELTEEVGVTADPSDLRLIMGSQMNTYRQYLNYTFVCETWKDEPRILEPEKCSDLAWFAPEELPERLTPTLALLQEAGFTEEFHFEYVDSARQTRLIG